MKASQFDLLKQPQKKLSIILYVYNITLSTTKYVFPFVKNIIIFASHFTQLFLPLNWNKKYEIYRRFTHSFPLFKSNK